MSKRCLIPQLIVSGTLLLASVLASVCQGIEIGQPQYVESVYRQGSCTIARGASLATIFVDSKDYAGVVRAAHDLQVDIARVTGRTPAIANEPNELGDAGIIVGTIGKSGILDRLVAEKRIDPSPITGKWESFLVQVVSNPLPSLRCALLIAGSDTRGTIFGIYDLSQQLGVSPWYWWADVPVAHQSALFAKRGTYLQTEPAVKYRGIFLNDEAPSLTGWVNEKFGGYNHEFYEKVFELLLRLKANYLWPAMWNSAFSADDSLNPKLADEYGIVMGTSHQEPMMRAWKEWDRLGRGPWDYRENGEALRAFWKQGIERNERYESVITIGMRGNGDLPMSQEANISLLEQIVADQRKIIGEVTKTNPSTVPQDWALYKEVQEYYEKGMRVPDDVTLLWCDDNWGNLRRLPTAEERKRQGGAGIYYHFDYVGAPRSYKWLNTIPITKIWEQMNLAYQYDANRIWVVNVGDLKPMEFPMEFFLTLAWDPQRWPKGNLGDYARLWAQREFGAKYAARIADIVAKYTKYNGSRKPELLEPDTFSLVNYQEADRMLAKWKSITAEAEEIERALPDNERDAFFGLVLYPTKASAQVAELYTTAGKNHLYASQGRASANDLAAQARALFQADTDLSNQYNHRLAYGKWNHMMDQTHIGYTGWNQPSTNVMPKVTEGEIPIPAALGVAVEGSEAAWPGSPGEPILPGFDPFNRQRRSVDVFNRGQTPFEFTATADAHWITLSAAQGTITKEERLWVGIDWSKAPEEPARGQIRITGAASEVVVKVQVSRPDKPSRGSLKGFVEADGYVSMESEHYTGKHDAGSVRWEKIPDLGRTLSSMSVFPVIAPSVTPQQNSPCLEYQMYLFDSGKFDVEAILAPTLNFVPGRGLRYAISFDDEPPQIVDALASRSVADWETSVQDGVRKVKSMHTIARPGEHTLKFWMVDPGVVLEKLVVNFGGVKPSYFGPPESYRGHPGPTEE